MERGVACAARQAPGGRAAARLKKTPISALAKSNFLESFGTVPARSTRDLSDCWSGNAAEAVSGFHRVLAEARCRQLIPFNSGFAVLWAASHECSGLVTGRTFPPIFVYQTAYDKDL